MAPVNASVLSAALYAVEVVGIAAFALSGIIEAARRRMDAVGVTAVAGLAAFGGGTLRDLLLDRRPLFWVEHSELLWMVLVLAIAAILFLRGKHFALTERAMQLPDAIGLGLFCASGTQIALAMELPALVCVVMGLFTGIIGGVLRDIVCNEIPRVFSDHRPYALCAFAGGWVLIAADTAGLEQWLCLLLGITTTSASRVAAILLDWRIPQWKTEQ
jgi:uncharacterized membrane protein YeiH